MTFFFLGQGIFLVDLMNGKQQQGKVKKVHNKELFKSKQHIQGNQEIFEGHWQVSFYKFHMNNYSIPTFITKNCEGCESSQLGRSRDIKVLESINYFRCK